MRSVSAGLLLLTLLLPSASQAATQAQVDQARAKALAWLLTHQASNGSWRAQPGSEAIASAAVLEAMSASNVNLRGYPYAKGLSWLSNAKVASTEALARRIIVQQQAGMDNSADLDLLLKWRNDAYAWGAYAKYATSFPDTALALRAIRLSKSSYFADDSALARGLCNILRHTDSTYTVAGPWAYSRLYKSAGSEPAAPPSIVATSYNIAELRGYQAPLAAGGKAWTSITTTTSDSCSAGASLSESITPAYDWVLARRKTDNSFGFNNYDTTTGSVLETARAYAVLTNPIDATARGLALDYLLARQSAAGDWGADPFQTAVVLTALPPPLSPLIDTDKDGIPDSVETSMGTSPSVADIRWLGDLGNGSGVPTVTIPQLIAAADLNRAFSYVAPSPGTRQLIAGSLPLGLSLNTSTGAISGTPTALGSFSFTLLLPDGSSQLAQITVTLPPDADSDGMPNDYEYQYGFNPNDPTDAATDADADGLTNLAEYQRKTDPRLADTDRDGMKDGAEVAIGRNPLVNENNIITIINSLLLD